MRIVVLGAAGQLGREVVSALTASQHIVRAVVRRPPVPALATLVDVHKADARNKTQIKEAITGFDAVINAIGAGTLRRNDVESTTTGIAVAAAEEVGVKRYIAMSAGMVALDCQVEQIVSASRLAWTIVRPPRLTNRPPAGYVASSERQPNLFLAARADVAAFIADEVRSDRYIRQAVFVASRPENDRGPGGKR